jgi:uncharacterized protein YidB (DUF937 family)
MGLLDDLLGGVLGDDPEQRSGQRGARPPAAAGGGMGGIMTALLPVLLSMLASRGRGAGATGGGLGDILGQVLGGGAPRGGGGLGDVLGGMLGRGAVPGGGAGALGGLLEQMQRAGFGDQARSWVGTGQNMPISPDALGQVFGQGGIEEIARQAGLTPREASEGLSELLPEVVDRVTPDGEVPDLDRLTMSVDSLRQRLGGA